MTQLTLPLEGPTHHHVDAGGVGFTFSVSPPTVTVKPPSWMRRSSRWMQSVLSGPDFTRGCLLILIHAFLRAAMENWGKLVSWLMEVFR